LGILFIVGTLVWQNAPVCSYEVSGSNIYFHQPNVPLGVSDGSIVIKGQMYCRDLSLLNLAVNGK
jgi:hypothetical protein